jgi:ribonuclease HI
MIREQQSLQVYKQIKSRRRTLEFNALPTTTVSDTPISATPIDIIQNRPDRIITNIPQPFLIKENNMPKEGDGLAQYISRNYPAWKHLHNNTEWAIDETKAQELLTTTKDIHLATDGGYKPKTGVSTYGWVIATEDTVVITGHGPAEAHPKMANSFRAEGYGAASALLYITAYYRMQKLDMRTKTWRIYINNKAMVDRLSKYSTPWRRKSKHQLRPEANITNVSEAMLQ